LVVLGVVSLWVAHLILYLHQLPEPLATHFNGAGRPNGWMNQRTFALFQLGLLGFIAFVFGVAGAAARVMPARFVNLPNRDYWLTEENRPQAMARLSRHLGWLFCGIVVFLGVTNHLVFVANASVGGPWLDGPRLGVVLAIGVACLVAWMVQLRRLFRVP
jgi:serine/threonine-protein kinase